MEANIYVKYRKNYLRVLEVKSSLNCKSEYKKGVGGSQKICDPTARIYLIVNTELHSMLIKFATLKQI